MRTIAIFLALMFGACAPVKQHRYSDVFDSCMAGQQRVAANFHSCTTFAFNYCADPGCVGNGVK